MEQSPVNRKDMPLFSRIEIEIADNIAEVRLDRPTKLNALDVECFRELSQCGELIATTKEIRAVILCGNGRSFCCGIDLQALSEGAGIRNILLDRSCGDRNLFQQAVMIWRSLPMPVIAAVHGHALGGGLQLALGADLRIVAPQTQLSVREIAMGLIPDMAGTALMRGLLRDDVARELVFTGRIFSGEEAYRLGIATRLSDEPLLSARDIARELAALSPDAMRAAKRLLVLSATGATEGELLAAEAREQHTLLAGDNHGEAVAAHFAGRPARFRD